MRILVHFVFISSFSLVNLFFNEIKFTKPYHLHSGDDMGKFHITSNLTTFAEVDAAADQYASTRKIFGYQEEIELRKDLQKQLEIDSRNIALNWALMRFYASAPNFVGGSTTLAIQFAGYIYSLNPYLGCLAFEYVYTKRKQFEEAENWYKQSLIVQLPSDMHWEDIIYNKTPQLGIKVTGNFSNWKAQNMYSNNSGTYKRRVMVPKCETCIYKVIVDYRTTEPTQKKIADNPYW